MNFFKISQLSLFLFAFSVNAQAQLSKTIDQIETQYKQCLSIKPDSIPCSRTFLIQMDSMLNVVFETVRSQSFADEKASLIQDQISWSKKKGEFSKIQDETFVYNLQEGVWKKDMIRITYQQKAEFVLRRIKALLKRLPE